MLNFLIAWVLNAVALYVTSAIVPGVRIKSAGGAFIGALVLAVVNAIVVPILAFLSLPLTVLTLGLFLFVVIGVGFWLAAALTPDFEVDGCLSGTLGALCLGLVNWLMGLALHHPNWF